MLDYVTSKFYQGTTTFTSIKEIALSLMLLLFSIAAFSQTGFVIKEGGIIATKV